MRVALFTEHDPAIPCGTATTIAALIGHLPDDIHIVSYHLRADRFCGLRARQILQRAEQERIDLIHLAACGPAAIIAMLVAWRLGVPIVGSISADFSSTLLGRRYVRAAVEEMRARVDTLRRRARSADRRRRRTVENRDVASRRRHSCLHAVETISRSS